MTTFNGEKYLRSQLDSILNQTYPDFELVICDDCSTDSTVYIINESKAKDSRIKLFINETNLGFKKNFEKAISLCKGEYIALSDQDDCWTKNHLQLLVENIKDNYLICGNNLIVNDDGKSTGIDFFDSNNFSPKIFKTNKDILKRILLCGNCFQGASMMMTKEFAERLLPFPENIKYHDLWMSSLASAQNKFSCTTEIVTLYRQHSLQVTRKSIKAEQFYISRLELISNLKKNNIYKENAKEIKNIEKFLLNQNNLSGRVKNTVYFFKNYKYIHPLKYKHIFHYLKYLLKGL